MSVGESVLELARDVQHRRDPELVGVWPRAVAFLGRQALAVGELLRVAAAGIIKQQQFQFAAVGRLLLNPAVGRQDGREDVDSDEDAALVLVVGMTGQRQ